MPNTESRATDMAVTKTVPTFDRTPEAPSARTAGGEIDARSAERVVCRIRALTVEFADAGGAWTRYVVPTRNISRAGLSILTNQYVFPKTACRVHLMCDGAPAQAVSATVVRCRYLPGTGRLHEVGLRFDAPIDFSLMQRSAGECRILLCDDDPTVHQIVPRLLNQLRVHVLSVRSGAEAARAVGADRIDIVLMNADLPGENGTLSVSELRRRGFSRPIVALTTPSDPKTLRRCLDAGFSQIASRPLTRDSLMALVKSLQCEPIVSALAHDPALVREIGAFVADLPDRLSQLEIALARADRPSMQPIVNCLRNDAVAMGFEVIASAAEELDSALTGAIETHVVRDRLSQLSKLAHAAQTAPMEDAAAGPRDAITRN